MSAAGGRSGDLTVGHSGGVRDPRQHKSGSRAESRRPARRQLLGGRAGEVAIAAGGRSRDTDGSATPPERRPALGAGLRARPRGDLCWARVSDPARGADRRSHSFIPKPGRSRSDCLPEPAKVSFFHTQARTLAKRLPAGAGQGLTLSTPKPDGPRKRTAYCLLSTVFKPGGDVGPPWLCCA